MSNNTEKELILEGLDCAGCAIKIEERVKKLEGIDFASLNFVSKSLKITLKQNNQNQSIIDEIKAIIKKLEPHVIVQEKGNHDHGHHDHHHHGHNHGEISKTSYYLAGTGALLYGAVLVFKPQGFIALALFIVSYILVGGPILYAALKNILRGEVFDENFLMSIATFGAFAIGEYPEAVAVMLFFRIGEYFQDRAVEKSRRSIKDLLDIKPQFANVKRGNEIIQVSPEQLKVGDIIVVKPGEKIAIDCKIISGSSSLDTSALTGESLPREVAEGDEVLGGMVNLEGMLTLEVAKEFSQSVIAKILDLVENSASKKAKTEKFITKFARYYTPAVVVISAALAIIPPLVLSNGSFSDWFYRALVFLVVSCPCALVVSIPLGFFGGIGSASKQGILVKGGNYLEALNEIDGIVFDKTGTLTKGQFKVTNVETKENFDKDQVLRYAALAEKGSNHPIAKSIVAAYGIDENIQIKEYQEIGGHGVRAVIDGKEIIVGNNKLMNKYNYTMELNNLSSTIVGVIVDGVMIGHLEIADTIKDDSKKAIEQLKKLGVKYVSMVTGDNKGAAGEIANQLSITEVYSELLPHQKVEVFEDILANKNLKTLAFVGDGINDAPVLARAKVGIAMGGLGSDAAIEAADVIIMDDKPSKIVDAIKIAAKTRQVVWQNIIFALAIKALVLILGAFGIATMWEAVFADVGVALLAVLNSMRTLKYD